VKIILTGGGTAGHVLPNLALVPALLDAGFEIGYIGETNGVEQQLATNAKLKFYGISAGKLRRYLSAKNIADAFRVIKGFGQARKVLRKERPDVIFSKGGFVAVPVVFAAKTLKIPVVIHESDITIGLANKLSIPRAKKVCYVFPETLSQLPKEKAIHTGAPLRKEVLQGSVVRAKKFCGFETEKPVIMIVGGSQGSLALNKIVRESLVELLSDFNIIHICGKGNVDDSLGNQEGYRQFEYIAKEMGDLLAFCDIVVSRAGANAIGEFLALQKPNILIPLSKAASRGDQILNAKSFEAQGFSVVVQEEDLDNKKLVSTIKSTFANKDSFVATMKKSKTSKDPISHILEVIQEVANSK